MPALAAAFHFGSKRWPGIAKLVEECGEVVQVCGDSLSGIERNRRLEEEIADVIAASDFVITFCELDQSRMVAHAATRAHPSFPVADCGAVIQVCGKLIATGGERVHWDGTDLKLRLEDAIAYLRGSIDNTIVRHHLVQSIIFDRVADKCKTFAAWHQERAEPASIERVSDSALDGAIEDLRHGRAFARDVMLKIARETKERRGIDRAIFATEVAR